MPIFKNIFYSPGLPHRPSKSHTLFVDEIHHSEHVTWYFLTSRVTSFGEAYTNPFSKITDVLYKRPKQPPSGFVCVIRSLCQIQLTESSTQLTNELFEFIVCELFNVALR